MGMIFSNVAFRSKTNVKTGGPIPWHDSFVVTAESREYALQPNIDKRDWFYHYFLEDLSLGVACYEKCKFKMYASSADIRIGDAWGSAYEKNEEGVSAVLTFTDKGRDRLDKCENLKKEDIAIDLLCEDQMPESPKKPSYYRLRLWLVKHTPFSLHQVNRIINGLIHYVKK